MRVALRWHAARLLLLALTGPAVDSAVVLRLGRVVEVEQSRRNLVHDSGIGLRCARRSRTPSCKHRWIDYERISNQLKRAVIASEDANFTEHEGVDWQAIEKAYKENVRKGKTARGGSTITQQLAKNLFLSSERSYWRKAQELVITYMIEALWDKRRILEVYLNVVEWGDGVFGAEAAARQYFGMSARRN